MSRTRCQFVVLLWQVVVIRGRLILAVRISRASSSRNSSRVSISVHISSRYNGGHVTEWVVKARGWRNTSRPLSSLPLAHMVSKLTSVGNLCSPPGSSSRRSRDKSGDVSRNQWKSSLASSQGNQGQGDNVA